MDMGWLGSSTGWVEFFHFSWIGSDMSKVPYHKLRFSNTSKQIYIIPLIGFTFRHDGYRKYIGTVALYRGRM